MPVQQARAKTRPKAHAATPEKMMSTPLGSMRAPATIKAAPPTRSEPPRTPAATRAGRRMAPDPSFM